MSLSAAPNPEGHKVKGKLVTKDSVKVTRCPMEETQLDVSFPLISSYYRALLHGRHKINKQFT